MNLQLLLAIVRDTSAGLAASPLIFSNKLVRTEKHETQHHYRRHLLPYSQKSLATLQRIPSSEKQRAHKLKKMLGTAAGCPWTPGGTNRGPPAGVPGISCGSSGRIGLGHPPSKGLSEMYMIFSCVPFLLPTSEILCPWRFPNSTPESRLFLESTAFRRNHRSEVIQEALPFKPNLLLGSARSLLKLSLGLKALERKGGEHFNTILHLLKWLYFHQNSWSLG